MEKEPTLKKALEPYLKGVESNIYYDPTGAGISALFLATLYAVETGSFSPTEDDRHYAKRVIEILLEYGADPTRHEADNPQYSTPLAAAKIFSDKGKDPESIYELLLKHSLNSATEAAFEEGQDPSGSPDKERFIKKAAKGLHKALMGAGNLGKKGLEKALKAKTGVIQGIAEKIWNKQDRKRLKEAEALAAKTEKGVNFSDLPGEAKEVAFLNELQDKKAFPELVSSGELDTRLKEKIAGIAVKSGEPRVILDTLKRVSEHLSEVPTDTKIWGVILNDKYINKGILKELSTLEGLSPEVEKFLGQISFIAYYLGEGKDLSLLKGVDGKTWKSLEEMKSLHSPKEEDASELTGREIILKDLGEKGPGLTRDQGVGFIASKLFEGDRPKAEEFISSNEDPVGKLLNKKFIKNFDSDNLLEKFVNELKKLIKPEEPQEPEVVKNPPMTGREIILASIGKKSSDLKKSEGISFIAKSLFSGDEGKADKFFEENRKGVSQALNRTYEKTFEEDDLSELFINDLKELLQKSKNENSENKLNEEQKQAALALQGLKFTKAESLKMVKGKKGDSSQIVYEALKSVGGKKIGK